eukprot:5447519-Prymnesium_polylepis.1
MAPREPGRVFMRLSGEGQLQVALSRPSQKCPSSSPIFGSRPLSQPPKFGRTLCQPPKFGRPLSHLPTLGWHRSSPHHPPSPIFGRPSSLSASRAPKTAASATCSTAP